MLNRTQDVIGKILSTALAVVMLASCDTKNQIEISYSTAVSGLVKPMGSSGAFAAASTCSTAVARLHEVDVKGALSSAIATTPVAADGSYSFSGLNGDSMGITKTGVAKSYVINVEGCDKIYSRFVTRSPNQDVSFGSSLVSYIMTSTFSKEAHQAYASGQVRELEQLITLLDSASSHQDAFAKLQTDPTAKGLFVSLFKMDPVDLKQATPLVAPVSFPAELLEGQAHELKVNAFHWDPSYGLAVMWRKSGEFLGTSSPLIFSPTDDSQVQEASFTLYVGRNLGNGQVDLSKPHYSKIFRARISNTRPAVVPPVTLASSAQTRQTTVYLQLETGPARAACSSFQRLAITENSTVVPDQATFAAQNLTCTQAPTQLVSYTLSDSSDGAKLLRVWAMDSAGNISQLPRSVTVTLDQNAPVLGFLSPAAATSFNSAFTLTGTCESGYPVNIGGTGIAAPKTAACSGGQFSESIALSAGDGTKEIRLSQQDLAGNLAQRSRNFVHDTTAPVLSIATPAANARFQNNLTLTGACESGLTVSITGSGVAAPVNTPCTASAFSANVLLSVGEGTKTLVVAQTDAAGNTGSATRDFVRDNTPPSLAIAAPAANTPAQTGLTISGSCETGLTVSLGGAGITATTTSCSAGTFSSAVSFSAGEGTKTVTISQTDEAGNTASNSRDFVRDNSAPGMTITSPAANTSAQTGVTLQGTCEPGWAISLSGAGHLSPATTVCNVGGLFSVAVLFSAGEGTKTISVSQTDGAGNTGSASRDFIRDNTAPLVAYLSPAANTTAQTGLTISGSCESPFDVEISGSGLLAPLTTACVLNGFSQAISFSAGDGVKTIELAQTDLAGNIGTTSRDFVRDNDAPDLAFSTPAANTTAQTGLTITGTCEAGLTVDVAGSGITATTTTCAAGTFSTAVGFTAGEGTKTVSVSQTDAAGNTGSASRDFVRDNTAPALAFSTPAANTTAQTGLTITGTCEAGLTVDVAGSGITATTTTCAAGTFSTAVSFTAGEGTKTVSVSQTDAAGNTGSASRDFVRDNTAPALAFSTPAANTTAQTGLTITGTCEAGLTVDVAGSGITTTTTTCAAGTFSTAVSFTAGEGTKTVSVSQTDAAGNTGSVSRDFIRDNTAPVLAFSTPAANTTAQTGLTITGTCETGLTVNFAGAGISSTTASCTAGAFSAAVSFTAGEGTKAVSISQTDAAGNTGSVSRDFVRDNTAPVLAFSTPAANTTAQTGLTITGTCEAGLTVNVGGSGITATTTTCAAGTFSTAISFTAGEGTKTVSISQTDAAGNTGSASRDFVRDNTAPVLAFSTPAANTTAQTGLTITGTCEAGLTVNVGGSGISATTTTCAAGTFSTAVSFTAGEGTKTVSVSQTDAAGNTGSASRNFVRDNTAPALAFSTPAANTTAQTGLTITGTCEAGLTVNVGGSGITATTTSCAAGTFSTAVSFTAGEGTKTVSVSQTDAAGNTGSASRDFVRDNTAPVLAFSTPAANTVAQTGLTITGTCETGLTVNLAGTGITATTATCTAGAFSSAVTFTAGDGTKAVSISQTDAAGNIGTSSRNFVRDDTDPVIAFSTPAANTTAQTGLTVTGTCETGLTVNLAGTGITATTATCTAGAFSTAVVFTAGEGTKSVSISQTDVAGNIGSASRDFVRDNTAPVLAFSTPAANTAAQTGLTITGTCETGLTVNLAGTGITATTATCTAGAFSSAVTFTAGDGTKAVSISQTDAAGNVGTTSRNFVRDDTDPILAFSTPAANTTAQTGLTVTGTCETGLTVNLAGTGITATTATCTAGAFSSAVTFTAGEGTKSVSISQTDAVGNTGSASRDFVRDNTAPVLAFSTPAANTAAQTGLTITGTCETGLTVNLAGTGINATTATCTAGAFSSAVTFTAGDGTKAVSISQTDAAGNVGTTSRNFVRDDTDPVLAFSTPAANTSAQTGLTITGTCETGLTVNLAGTGITATTATCTASAFSVAVTFTAGEGSKAVSISQTDAVGNTGTASRSFVRDNTAPVLAFSTPAANTAAQTGLTITGTCETGLTVNLAGTGITATTATCTAGAFSSAVTFTAGDGTKAVSISQTDAAGNVGTTSRNFVRDDTDPVLAFSTPAANTSAQTGLTITGTCETGLTVNLAGTGITATTATCTAGAFSSAVTFTAGEGSKAVSISQTDAVGNTGTASRSFVRDNTAPVLAFSTPAANTAAQTGLTITGTCETGLTVNLAGTGITATTATCTAGAFSSAVTFTAGDGTKAVSISQTDAAGNIGTTSRNFVRDDTDPVLAFSTPAANTSAQTGLTITGTCETGLTVNLAGTGITATTATCTASAFSVAVTFTAGEGSKAVSISQTDAVGNTGTASRSFVRDNTAPVLAFSTPAANTPAQTGLTVTGTCETGLTVNLAGTGITATTATCTAGAFSSAVTFTAGDGTKAVSISQTDAAGNVGTASRNFVRDDTNPVLAFSTPAANTSAQTGLTITGTCETGLTVNLAGTGITATTATCTAGAFSVAVTFTAGEGSKAVSITQTDAAGNIGTASRSFVRDNTAPVLAFSTPAANTPGQTGLTITGTCETGLTVNLAGTGITATTATCTAGAFSSAVTFTAGDGTKAVSISQTDAAGNVGTTSRNFVRDDTNPVLAFSSPAANTPAQTGFTVSGTCETGLTVNLAGTGITATTATCTAGAFSTAITFTAGEGTKTVSISQTDAAGNVGTASRNFIRDNTAPVLAFSTPAANTPAQTGLTITGTCEAGLNVSVGGTGITSTSTTCAAGTFSVAVTFTAGDGTKAVTVSQTDVAGNVGSSSRNFVRDTTAPTLAFSTPAANASGQTGLTITGTCETGLTVTVNGAGITATTATCTASAFSVAVTFTAGEGTKAVSISQTDAAGNTSSASRNFVRDNTAPVLAFSTPAANTVGQNGLTVTGTCETGLTVNLAGTGITATTATCTAGAFSRAVTFTAGDGTKAVSISQTDAAGNTGTTSRNFTRDATPPALTVTAAANGTSAQSSLTMTGACETGLDIDFAGAGLLSAFSITCSGGTYSQVVFFSAGDGTKTITVTQTDAVTNTTTVSRNYVRDNGAPPITQLTVSYPHYSNTNTITFGGACETGLTVTMKRGVTTEGTATCTSGTWSRATASQTTDATRDYTFEQTDAAGNTGTANGRWIRDTVLPALAITSSASMLTASNSVTFSGTCETGLPNDIQVSNTDTSSTPCNSGSWSYTTATRTTDAVRTYTFSLTDSAGNVRSVNATWERNTQYPNLLITTPNPVINKNNTATIAGTCQTGLNIEVRRSGVLENTITCPAGTFSYTTTSQTTDASRPYEFRQTNAIPLSTNQTISWVRDTVGPVFTATYFKIDNNAAYTSKSRVNIAMRATDSLTKIKEFCLKVGDTTAPSVSDGCWVAVDSPDIGLTPATTVNVTTYGYNLPLVPGTYDLYAFAKDEATNVSALTSAGAGTALQDKESILYDLAVPPTMHKVLIGSTDAMSNPPTPSDLTVGVGSPVFIKWRVTDDVALPATPVSLYFTTDDTNWSLIASGLTNGANGACVVNNAGTSADNDATGCYRWAASPTSGYFKVRVVVNDNTGLEAGLASVGMNVAGSIRFIAGNTETGTDMSAQAAVFFNRTLTQYAYTSADSLAVSREGVIFIIDGDNGLAKVDPVDGLKKIILPQTGTTSGNSVPVTSATARMIQKIALDYSQPKQGLWIYDYDRIRRLDLATNMITTVIGGSGSDNADTVANPLTASVTATTDTYWRTQGAFFAMPNGDFYFQAYNDLNGGIIGNGTFRVRYLEASTGSIKSFRLGSITHVHGLATADRSECTPRGIGFVRDSGSVILERLLQVRTADHFAAGCETFGDSLRISRLDATGNSIGTAPGAGNSASYIQERGRYHQGLDGKLYYFSKENGAFAGVWYYNPAPTSTWTRVYGTNSQGWCSDGTAVTACATKIDAIFVSENGTLFVMELGAIRTITPTSTVQTISGQPIVSESGTEVLSSRLGVDVRNFQVRNNGAIIFADNMTYSFFEFARGGTLQKIAGNGTLTNPTYGVDSLTTGSSIFYDTWAGGYFAADPATGDIYHAGGRMRISKLTRNSTTVGASGIWSEWAGNGTYGPVHASAEGSADVGFDKDCTVGFDPGVHSTASCGWLPLILGIFNNKVYTMFSNYSHFIGTSNYAYRNRSTRLYDLTTKVQTTLVKGSDNMSTSGALVCAPGTSLSDCDFLSNRTSVNTHPDYDSVTNTYYAARAGYAYIYGLPAGGTLQRYATTNGVSALAFRRDGSTRYVYYCSTSSGQIRKYNLETQTDTALTWPVPSLKCNYMQMVWSPSTTSVIFTYRQNGLSGFAEYIDP